MIKHKFFDEEKNILKVEVYNSDFNTIISRNVKSFHAAINPNLIKNKENFLIKIRLNFPDLPIKKVEQKLNKGKYFYLKKRLTNQET